jgi:hypothetical protein
VYRDVFEDLLTRVFEPLLKDQDRDGLSLSETLLFFSSLAACYPQACSQMNAYNATTTSTSNSSSTYYNTGSSSIQTSIDWRDPLGPDAWYRYVGGVRVCLLFMYRHK